MKGTVSFDHVRKRYRLGASRTLRSLLGDFTSRGEDSRRVLWALDDVSFHLDPGQSLGLIGPNGAGKTTALKLLSNITRPTSGSVAVEGRLSSLIELGAGFHPELTGRENIFLNAAILGLGRREVADQIDNIITFSGLERFIDTPVKRYSSGMYVRLAFAVAAHMKPDILLVDEVLAVGDAQFRQQCMMRIEEIRAQGTTIAFVSHNMYLVRQVCQRAMLLVHGKPMYLGDTDGAIAAYEKLVAAQPSATQSVTTLGVMQQRSDIVVFGIEVKDDTGTVVHQMRYDERLTVETTVRTTFRLVDPVLRAHVVRIDGMVCAMATSRHQSDLSITLCGQGRIRLRFDPVQLTTGDYSIQFSILDSGDTQVLACGQSDWFHVQGPHMTHETDRGFFCANVTWSQDSATGETPELVSGNQSSSDSS
ncbi:MAG: ABC transporter ATP-binding protein [Anaerolineae bacterium]